MSSGLIINISLLPSNMSVLENGMGVVAHD